MEKNKDIFVYRSVLALDTIFDFLTVRERQLCHLITLRKTSETTEGIERVAQFIIDTNWERPICRYDQDRVLYYHVSGDRKISAQDYRRFSQHFEEKVKSIYNNIKN